MQKIFTGRVETSREDFENANVGRLGKITVAVNPPLTGRVMIGDAEWTAASASPIAVGANVRIVSQDNLTMTVEAV